MNWNFQSVSGITFLTWASEAFPWLRLLSHRIILHHTRLQPVVVWKSSTLSCKSDSVHLFDPPKVKPGTQHEMLRPQFLPLSDYLLLYYH